MRQMTRTYGYLLFYRVGEIVNSFLLLYHIVCKSMIA